MYEITIDNFSGPMDLLLHLIKQSKMDIMNIKLEIIIDEYLDYINKMTEMNLDISRSYLVMGSELLEIKSKMLLPKEEDEEEEEDPKERLINRLILYQQYKDQIDSFKELESERGTYYTKIPSSLDDYQTGEKKALIENVTLDDLVKAFENFLARVELEKPVSTKVTKKELSVEDRIINIKDRFKKQKRIDFFDLFEVKSKEYVVVTFLAILEMAKNKELIIYQDANFDNIICEAVYGRR
jgi:segregation and condensation protein A